ncbi:MAG: S8 family serine peptidase [Brevefilum sp.]
MARRIALFLISTLLVLTLVPQAAAVEGQTPQVGVRIPAQNGVDWERSAGPVDFMIDYGAFTWTVMSPSALAELDRAGVDYQAVTNPYALTLGGETFDPLISPPQAMLDGAATVPQSGPGLHLVQFHGPTKSAWLDALEAAGLEIVQYIHPFTYVVWGEGGILAGQSRQDFVRWTGDYLPAYALQPGYRTLAVLPSHVRILVYPRAGLDEILKEIIALGGTHIAVQSGLDSAFDLVTCVLPGDQLRAAAALPGVYTLQPVPTDGGTRGEMSNQVTAGNILNDNRAFPGYLSWLDQLGLSGQGVVMANVDSGLDQTHPDLANRMLPCNGLTCGGEATSGHGTHTAGIMAGDGTSGVTDSLGFLRGLGMAPGAGLIEQLYTPTYQDPGGVLTLMTESYRNLAVISGNSWGPSGTPKGYDADTRLVDLGVRDADPDEPGNQPLTYVLSIMNGYGGVSSQGTPDEAKNVFSVGSTVMQNSNGSQNLNINNLSFNTAHGPALDGRHLPDMVAPGCYVDSTYTSTYAYRLLCGTSMASPHVSGAAALFYEFFRGQFGVDPSPALVKAAFLPVAHDLAGNLDADGLVLGHPFDSKQGWGRLNLDAVLNPPGEVVYFDQDFIFSETGQTWSTSITLDTPVDTLRAMLVWTDAPGHGLGGSTPAWVNDLDLSLVVNGQTYYGNNFGEGGFSVPGGAPDGRNNTEKLFLSALPEGTYTLTVTAANISGDGVPGNEDLTDQDFALVVYYEGEQIEQPIYRHIFIPFFRNDGEETQPSIYRYIFPLFFR